MQINSLDRLTALMDGGDHREEVGIDHCRKIELDFHPHSGERIVGERIVVMRLLLNWECRAFLVPRRHRHQHHHGISHSRLESI